LVKTKAKFPVTVMDEDTTNWNHPVMTVRDSVNREIKFVSKSYCKEYNILDKIEKPLK